MPRFIKNCLFAGIATLVACGICEKRDKNVGQIEGHFLKQEVAKDRISDFFNSESGSFFPMENWVLDFEYKAKRKKLYLTLLGVGTDGRSKYSIVVSNDSILISPIDKRDGCFTQSIVNEDLKYVVKGISPKTYKLIYNGLNLDLDLSHVNEKENYSILSDGSFVVMSDEVGSEDI